MELTEEQKKQIQELSDLTKEIIEVAKDVKLDYDDNPSEMSGSVTQVHIDSPLLEDEDD